ncbi:AraC family transcriptional regulator [Promicromonospora citrea]|uniref:AraC family transcriptional regulator n=1 Tax=Promicromonospora citrea TaxID=43677 RepID=A0A8H9L5S6_9MICO|nr:AraC family transcriptional regulator [Promicromonospora citrea]NNH52233.1 AraC family transcriptional regulator [Promicromonospora citrea]GGM39973.1 AraC family transcriptional regulator [Promicromonospora citrea]
MAVDPLSEILALADARCVVTGELRAGGAWSVRFPTDAPVKLDAVVRGSCWLVADDEPPLHLTAGDAVVLNGVRTMVLTSDPALRPVEAPGAEPGADAVVRYGDGDDAAVLGGHVELDPASAGLFTAVLPRVLRTGADSTEAGEIRRLLERVSGELTDDRPGAAFAADQHAQLLLLHVLRAGLGSDALDRPGWLRLLADPVLRPAVVLMHAEPGRGWGLAELAAAVGMSRSHFAHRFRAVAGEPPLTYLARWRIRLARRALRDTTTTVAALATRLGYASESSFSHAFTRAVGVSPSRYRRTARPGEPARAR